MKERGGFFCSYFSFWGGFERIWKKGSLSFGSGVLGCLNEWNGVM